MKAKALFTVLSKKFRDGEIVFVDKIEVEKPKTAEAKEMLKNLSGIKGMSGIARKKDNAALVSLSTASPVVRKSFRNFSNILTTTTAGMNIIDVLNHKYLVMTEPESAFTILSSKLKTKSTKL